MEINNIHTIFVLKYASVCSFGTGGCFFDGVALHNLGLKILCQEWLSDDSRELSREDSEGGETFVEVCRLRPRPRLRLSVGDRD